MEKIKPFEHIAARFNISRESAKYFLNRVQKSFKTEKPPHQLIVDFLTAQEYAVLPAVPYEIAVAMKERGVWAYVLNSPPPAVVDDEDFD